MNFKSNSKLNFISFLFLFIFSGSVFAVNNSICPVQSFDLIPTANAQLNCRAYRQTTKYTCGPAAAMALLHYYGKLASNDMNSTTELRIADEMETITDVGTPVGNMVNWLERNGFKVDLCHHVSTDVLKDNIKKGIPILVIIDNHWTLATGYHVTNNGSENIMFTDSCVKNRVMNRDQIELLWFTAVSKKGSCNKNVGDYIVAVPR